VLVEDLLTQGHDVNILDIRQPTRTPTNQAARFTSGDIRDTPTIARLVSHADAIVNLAALVGASACAADPAAAWAINATALQRMCEHITPTQVLIHASGSFL
jgi:nucleoside-diphosphate-sugar epimerase